MIRFRALGGVGVTDGEEELTLGGSRQRRLLAVLLIHRNAVVSADRILEAVFAGEPTAAATTTLRSYVARVRRAIDRPGAASSVVTQSPGYVLHVAPAAFDVDEFERLVADAGALLSRGDAAGAAPVLREALGLWRGEAYAEFAHEEWAMPEARRLAEVRLVAHERLIEAELASGRAAELIPEIEALACEHPLRETFQAQLMTALYRSGRQADALRVFAAHREVLVEELGLEPSPALAELERRLLTHDPTLLLDEPAGQPLRGYRLGERLGTGRDGTVFAARLAGIDRDLAIRVFRQDVADSPAFIRSFESTVQRLATLRHPAIVPIHDYWREPGAAYLVMRRMHGGTLADRIARGPLTSREAEAVVGRIGGALAAAAEAGISHGRVSPEQVLFDVGGEPYLGDFDVVASGSSPQDDVRAFATMVHACAPAAAGVAHGVLVGADGAPSIVDLVASMTMAITGDDATGLLGPPNPYKGLRAFDEADAADFFGREDLVREILDRLSTDGLRGRLLLLVGGSGTGKSSLVRAGLLPRIRRGDVACSGEWLVTSMLPGSTPFKELAESLRRVAVGETAGLAKELARDGGIDRVVRQLVPEGQQLLLVIDQLEELFTLAGEALQRAFLRGVMDAVGAPGSRLRVVATLRADFYDRPLAVQPFGAAVSDATLAIPAMLPAELEAAIVEPAERVGAQVERALVTELVSAVVGQPGALPSLQFALYELAERSPARRLTLAAYREAGGVDGAIASRAETLYSSLDDSERRAIRTMFEGLVAVSPDGEPTRRRADRRELSGAAADPSVDDVIDRWVDARLLTLNRHPQTRVPTVEVAHEALLREWPRLRSWIDEDRETLIVLGRLREAAASWEDLGRDPGALYRGTRLAVALDATRDRLATLPQLDREFLVASREARERDEQAAADDIARQTRANRRLRLQLAVIGVALVGALIGGFVAVDRSRVAQEERRRATARELAAAADANLDDDPERSVLLALAAIDATQSSGGALPQAVEALHRAVTATRVVLTVPGVGGALDWSPEGDVFVTEGPEESGLVDIRDATSGASVRAFVGHDVDINGVAFSADGALLATTGDDGAVRVWDPATGDVVMEHQDRRYEPGPDASLRVVGPSFSSDGDLVAASFLDVVRVVEVASGDVVRTVAASDVSATAFSPDGGRLALVSYSAEGAVKILDLDSGDVTTLGGVEDSSTHDVEWSPDGRSIATVGEAGLRLWDATSGELRFTGSQTAVVTGVDWSPARDLLATVSEDGTAVVSEVTDGGLRDVLVLAAKGRSQSLASVAFSADGTRVMAGDLAITAVTVWDITLHGGAEWSNVPATPWSDVGFTAAGDLVRIGEPGTIEVSDARTGDHLMTLALPADAAGKDIAAFDVSDDGSVLAAVAWEEGAIEVWDLDTGAHRFSHPLDTDAWVTDLELSPDGEHLAVAMHSDRGPGEVAVLDGDGDVVSTVREQAGRRITAASFSADGRWLATTREGTERIIVAEMEVRIWDWESGEIVRTIDAAAAAVWFDPMGRWLATNRRVEAAVDVWELSTGRRLTTLAAGSPITALDFSADGATIATGHVDGSTRLWDARSGVQQLSLAGAGSEVASLAFNREGTILATSSTDGVVRVWALELDDLVAIARDRLTRGFTDEECRQYLHLASCPSP